MPTPYGRLSQHPTAPVLKDIYEDQARASGEAIEEAYNPLEDLPMPVGAFRKLLTMGAAGLGGLALGRVGVLPGRERIASEVIKRGLKEPWFHGTPRPKDLLPPLLQQEYEAAAGMAKGPYADVVRRNQLRLAEEAGQRPGGFDPARVGANTGTRLGEPAGVSLTRDPNVARGFGQVLRVGVDVPPSSVGQFVDPEFQKVFREAYEQAWPAYEAKGLVGPYTKGSAAEKLAKEFEFNKSMSDHLRSQGVEAIAYNPRRWEEFEMRVLDPKRAVPLGVMPEYHPHTPDPKWATALRYYQKLRPRLGEQMRDAPAFPIRLHDLLPEATD